MGVVRRTKDGIDILEHAMQGVHTSENRGKLVRFHSEPGIVGVKSTVEVRALEDTQREDSQQVEREVIVRMPRLPPRRRAK